MDLSDADLAARCLTPAKLRRCFYSMPDVDFGPRVPGAAVLRGRSEGSALPSSDLIGLVARAERPGDLRAYQWGRGPNAGAAPPSGNAAEATMSVTERQRVDRTRSWCWRAATTEWV